MDNIKYSVVIPVYNSEVTLWQLCNRIFLVFENITDAFEIIFVDDGSVDDSWKKLEEIKEEKKNKVKIIQLMRNFGQHNALMCGFGVAEGAFIITMDDDLQNPPEEIPKMISEIDKGYDLVYGEYLSKKHSLFRNAGSEIIQLIYKKIFNVAGKLTAFRIMRKELLDSILKYEKNYVFIDGLLAWATGSIGYAAVTHSEREYNNSGYSFKKLLTLSVNMLTNFSIMPLQIASVLGIFFASVGFIMAMYFVGKKVFFGSPVQGYTSLMVVITFFSGIQLLTLGLVGEYIGRIHLNINKKPQYEIRKQL